MVEVTPSLLHELEERLAHAQVFLHIDTLQQTVAELERVSSAADFWNDAASARVTMEKLTRAKQTISRVADIKTWLEDAQVALQLADETADEAFRMEASDLIEKLESQLTELELASWFTEEFDHGNAIVTVTPGQGGLEAQDWADMLFHMYLKYCALRGWKVTINDAPTAEVIGIDRATFTVAGENAYGMLRAEQGVHRLVRISPTDDKKRRQTSFAGVEVIPVLPADVDVQIDPNDLRIDVYHASGHGGQGVNTTDSAVRITHLPTGIVVTCQNERSQLQNKAFAMQILRSRLYELKKAEREAELDELRGPKHDISFGNQIRSYVLYPYQMVKDLRTGVETGKVNAILENGELDEFIIGYHRWVAAGKPNSGITDIG